MKKKIVTILSILMICIMSSSIAYGYESWEYSGWVYEGTPKYTWSYVDSADNLLSCPSHLASADVSGSNIMYRLRKSYTLTNRASKIVNANYMQRQLYAKDSVGNNHNYAKITYKDSPYGLGYTEWYDSPTGLFLDYEHQFARYIDGEDKGKVIDKDVGVDVVQDSIFYNRVQYPSIQQKAFVATNNSALADAKTASILQRNGKNYPIYLNNGRTLDSNVYQELLNKGVKDIYLLGGDATFDYTAGMTNGFNVIRIGGLTREETKELLKKMPSKMETPQHYKSDGEGYVMQGVPSYLQPMVKTYLVDELKRKDGINLIACAKQISEIISIGNEPNQTSDPSMIIGINDGTYETYWICYWKKTGEGYVYQFVLGGYYDEVKINSEITSIDTSNTVYKQNNSTYWTGLNSDVNINTRGTTNVKYDMESVALSLYNGSYGSVANSPKHTVNTWGTELSGNFNNSFTNVTTRYGSLGTYNGQRSITATHKIRAKEDNKAYNLYSSAQLGYCSTPVDSGLLLKTDGTSPEITGIPSSNWTREDVNFTIGALDRGSGLNSIILSKGGNIIGNTVNLNTEGIYDYVASAKDNVNNSRNILFTVKIDKTAPTGDVKYDFNIETGKADFIVSNIIEKGSGVKEIWVEYTDIDNLSNKNKEILSKSDTTYIGGKKITELLGNNITDVNVKVWAKDNVENTSLLFEQDIDLLKINASITRVLETHNPIFREGEKGILHINTYGGVEKVKIVFPYELTSLDNTLNSEISLNSLPVESIEYEFFIPLGTKNKNYNVQVIGYKKNKAVEVYPVFEVSGSITKQLRTRIRNK